MKFRVHPSVSHIQAMLANMEERTGMNPDAWADVARGYGLAEVNALGAKLKAEHGLGKPTAWLLASYALGETPEDYDGDAYLARAPELFDAQFSGKKEALRPLAEKVIAHLTTLGNDVGVSPTKTMVPIYRHHVFAQVKAATQTRLDVGLALGRYDGELSSRIKDTGGALKGDRITHVIGVTADEQIDDDFIGWLRKAYELDDK
ncbi:DUF5655 domain-containing protein [Kordiimonas gwangyangensis]|uniref:DUF5655 domain-containing protein n=1 Tax=Kordiimonas gwangyangensis TaxID=288022 RepID=UPI00036C513E|nr:DUF5655 domain-containing protein [Kordiimonas gwangyangensis]